MRNPRHQLILLGFLCQGLAWDDYLLPLVNTLLWVLCLSVPRKPQSIHPVLEAVLVLGGIVVGYLMSRAMGQDTHFSFGHGITVIQAVRLMRPLNYRERVISALMALFQIGVACTVILDYRFILLFLAMVWLLPKSFVEIESSRFVPVATTPAVRLSYIPFLVIAVAAIAFFLIFPRGIIGTPLQVNRARGGDPGSLLDNVLDPARGGAAQSGQVIFSVEGHNVGYLRCYALPDFDGMRWTAEGRSAWRPIETTSPDRLATLPLRRVRAKNSAVFGRVLPTDGKVALIRGTFFRRAFQNAHGMIESDALSNTANNVYEYRIDPHRKPEALSRVMLERCTRLPQQSARLHAWLDQIVGLATAPTEQARLIERHLRENFTYRLGAPELSRLNPVDDFIFNQKEGHCERFASTLALLLRMKGIPSKVVIGYLPTTRNWISGWYDVRFKDAHAWTEAYFKDLGWVQLDATPGISRETSGFDFKEFFEAIDTAWYANVVNFDANTQNQLFAVSLAWLVELRHWIASHALTIVALVVLVGLVILWRRRVKRPQFVAEIRRENQILAAHYYGELLRSLARKNLQRAAQLTPLEFLDSLRLEAPEILPDAALITHLFCASRYGDEPISLAQKAEIETALESIRRTKLAGAAGAVR